MAVVTRFEDLFAWQEARILEQIIYKISNQGAFAKDFRLRDQIQSAAVSAMTNIAEGFDNESSAEFARFLGMARRSAVEVQSLLYVALDQKYISLETFQSCYSITAQHLHQLCKSCMATFMSPLGCGMNSALRTGCPN